MEPPQWTEGTIEVGVSLAATVAYLPLGVGGVSEAVAEEVEGQDESFSSRRLISLPCTTLARVVQPTRERITVMAK